MASDNVVIPHRQACRAKSSSTTYNVPAHFDNKTGRYIVLWREIQRAFKNAECIINNGDVVPFLFDDENFEELIPQRIAYIPGVTLEVILDGVDNTANPIPVASPEGPLASVSAFQPPVSQQNDGEVKISAAIPLVKEESGTKPPRLLAENLTEEEDGLSLQVNSLTISDISPISNNLIHPNDRITKLRLSFKEHQQLCHSLSQAYTFGQMNQAIIIADQAKGIKDAMNEHFGDMRIDMNENKALQEQILQMQRQMDESQKQLELSQKQMELNQRENQKQVMEMQLRLEENQKQMMKLQQQSLDRLAIIQNRIQAVLTQTYELHEYPIPRLFIILPKPARLRDKLGKLFSNHFRLYFLCECGKHTMAEGSTTQHEIHLAKHEGYDIEQPNEFFDKYGSYILTLMQMFKYGITTASVIVPALSTLKLLDNVEAIKDKIDSATKSIGNLVDEAINFLETRQSNAANIDIQSGESKFDKLEALEGADLRQLESYLKVNDSARVLGNLYRIVTLEGHVKWVCLDHYRETYKEAAVQQLKDIVEANSGTFTEEIGKIEIAITSNTLAKQFYDAMVKARGIQELDITFGWDATMNDLRVFATAVVRANIIQLTVDGTNLKGPASDVINRGRRFDPIVELINNGRIQFLRIKNFNKFLSRVSGSSAVTGSQLRVLWMDSDIDFDDKTSRSVITKILDNCPSHLELKLNEYSMSQFCQMMDKRCGPHFIAGKYHTKARLLGG
ncbi:hypothetical protein BGX26_002870 [Mortierella sp. AD094]|nr:hypothetical protein BGX26_002870 [Mortierella sp. AD094]